MGFFLSVLYLVTNYLTPQVVFGPLAAFHIQFILAAMVTIVSVPVLSRSFIFKTPQSFALIGLAVAVMASMVVGARWIGGGVQAFFAFIPHAFAYFLVCLHCTSRKRLQVLVAMLLFVCLFVLARGGVALLHVPADVSYANAQSAGGDYLMAMNTDIPGKWLYRLRGLGEINDPNDFGQLIICLIPLMFLFWRPKRRVLNILCVLAPISALLVALFLTHSRGALLGLLAIGLVAARRRIGTVPAVGFAGVLFVGLMALQFTGGRGISTNEGADRFNLWGESLQVFKAHPLFGIGFGNLPDYIGQTAHNSVAVCAAELGLVGLFFWSMFLFSTVRDTLAVASAAKVKQGKPLVPEPTPFPQRIRMVDRLDKEEANAIGRLVLLSMIGFLVSGWFLSRAFATTLFLLGGMAEVLYQVVLDRGMVARRLRLARVVPYSAALGTALVLVVYVSLRIVNLTR